jgi:tRNA nucleotidyltransferase (CCA-adding enzyme)
MTTRIEEQVLEVITPKNKDRKNLEKIIKDLKREVNSEIHKRNLPASIVIVGSTSKDTYLKDSLDIDLFLTFPTNYLKEKMGKQTLEIGRMILEQTEECYAEHPYIRGYFKNYKIEIVPSYKIESASQKLSAVDRTPLHTEFIRQNLKAEQKQEVRLFKQFLKGIGCYGAEAEIEGFSGYLCEILILRYGSFKDLIKNAKRWKAGEKISLSYDDFPFFNTPLIFIDPVDNDRNVASAISLEKFDLFVRACNEYFEKPSINFFFPNPVKPWMINYIRKILAKKDKLYVGIEFDKPKIIDENLYPQVRKAARAISKVCKRYGFKIYNVLFYIDKLIDKINIIIITDTTPISKTYIHKGPPIGLKNHTKEFVRKWENNPIIVKGPYEKNNRMYVEIEREYIEIKEFLKYQIKSLSLGKDIDRYKKSFIIINQKRLLRDNLRVFWTIYLDNKAPWER